MATKKDVPSKSSNSAAKQKAYVTQKAFNEHFDLDFHAAKNMIADGLLKVNGSNQIASSELDRPTEEIRALASGSHRHTLTSAGTYMGLSASAVKRLIKLSQIRPVDEYKNGYGRWISLYAQRDLDKIMEGEEYRTSLNRAKTRQKSVSTAAERLAAYKDEIASRVKVNIRERSKPLPHAHIYIGPTNSGKTYRAMRELIALYQEDPNGKYAYAGPLRLLAYEWYQKIGQELGFDNVGFVTGEEQINECAPIICCTVECAPASATALVLDEAHWVIDDDRGMHWTNLLIGGQYDHLIVVTAKEASKTIKKLIGNATCFESEELSRLLPVEFRGKMNIGSIPPQTAIVAFSRKAVFALAREVTKKTKRKVGVLYGAMPLETRKAVLDRYSKGELDVIVCTDVIGHGINLPIDNIVMAETQKYDGTTRRALRSWECAQIVGRAGRYGLSDRSGAAYCLSGLSWAKPSENLVSKSTEVANGNENSDLSINKLMITPSFEDLGIEKPVELMYALDVWEKNVKLFCELQNAPLTPSKMPTRRALIEQIASLSGAEPMPKSTNKDNAWKMDANQLWTLSGSPLSPDSDALPSIVEWMNMRDKEHSDLLSHAIAEFGYYAESADINEEMTYQSNERAREEFEKWKQHYADHPEEIQEAKEKKEEAIENDRLRKERRKIVKANKKHKNDANYKQKKVPPIVNGISLKEFKNSKWGNVPITEADYKRAERTLQEKFDQNLQSAKENSAYYMEVQERAYKELCQLASIYNAFGNIRSADINQVHRLISGINDAEKRLVKDGIRYNDYGICSSCGGQCAPWFSECDKCHSMRFSRYNDYYDDYYW